MVNGLACTTDAAAETSSLAKFNDSRCREGCVDSTDPLLFTCELHNVIALRVELLNGTGESISIGDTISDVVLPVGFNVKSLEIQEINDYTRNIFLSFSIANVSLLDDGEIICHDVTPTIELMAVCPVCGKFSS